MLVQVQVVGRSRQALSWPCGSRSRECARGRREWRREEVVVVGAGRDAGRRTQEVQRRTGWVKYGRLASLSCAVLCCAVRLQRATRCRGGIQARSRVRQTGSEQEPEPERGWIEEQQDRKTAREYTATLSPNQIKSNQLGRPPHTPQPQRFTLFASHFAQQQQDDADTARCSLLLALLGSQRRVAAWTGTMTSAETETSAPLACRSLGRGVPSARQAD